MAECCQGLGNVFFSEMSINRVTFSSKTDFAEQMRSAVVEGRKSVKSVN